MSYLNKKKVVDNIVILIFSLFSIEYVSFGEGISIFRMIIFPLSLLGLSLLRPKNIKGQQNFYIIILIILLANVLSAANSNNMINGFFNSLGIFIFMFFILNYFMIIGVSKKIIKIIAFFSIPQYLAFCLWLFLGMGQFYNTHGRFIGFHVDPNFLSMYLNFALVAKFNLLSQCKSRKSKFGYLLFILLDYMLIFSAQSRIGILGALLSFLLFLFFYHKKVFIVLITLSGFIINFLQDKMDKLSFSRNFNTIDGILYRFKNVDANGNEKEMARLVHFNNFVDIISNNESVFIGLSLQNYYYRFLQYPHNLLIDMSLELGLVTAIIFIIYLIILFIKGFLFAFKNKKNSIFFQLALVTFVSSLFLTSYKQKFFWFMIVILFISSKKIKINFI